MSEAQVSNLSVNLKEAANIIEQCLKVKLVPMMTGSPALGKSAIVAQIAQKFGLKMIDLRLSQCDPTDLLGYPTIDKATGKAHYAPMSTFPLEGDPIPEGYNGWLLFLDELTSASRSVQAAGYKLILDHMVGEHKLHPRLVIIGAGNRESDGAIVEPMSTALQSRLVHVDVVLDVDCWLEWAMHNGIDHRITSYIKFKPDMLYTFQPDHTDKTYGSPRTWEFTNRLVNGKSTIKADMLNILGGCISEGLAREFIGFCSIYADLPTVAQIAANPEGITMPDEPSVLYALSGSLANHATPDTMDKLYKFILRMPIEFQIVTLREVVRRNKEMVRVPAVQNWLATQAVELF